MTAAPDHASPGHTAPGHTAPGHTAQDHAAAPGADAIETTILALTTRRGAGKSICPSEVARALRPEGWQSLMTPVRQAAVRLVVAGRIDILRKGRPVAPDAVHGVIRLRIKGDA